MKQSIIEEHKILWTRTRNLWSDLHSPDRSKSKLLENRCIKLNCPVSTIEKNLNLLVKIQSLMMKNILDNPNFSTRVLNDIYKYLFYDPKNIK